MLPPGHKVRIEVASYQGLGVVPAKTPVARWYRLLAKARGLVPPPEPSWPLRPLDRGYVLSRYPVLKIHQTMVKHMARKRIVMVKLTPTLTSVIP